MRISVLETPSALVDNQHAPLLLVLPLGTVVLDRDLGQGPVLVLVPIFKMTRKMDQLTSLLKNKPQPTMAIIMMIIEMTINQTGESIIFRTILMMHQLQLLCIDLPPLRRTAQPWR
jgi:hypothetical protein